MSLNDTVLPPGTASTPLMEFQVWDKNDTHASSKIGTCIVPMFPFQMNDGHTGENWFPIRSGKGKNTKLAGEIHVASQWLPEGMLAGARGPKLSGDRPLYVHVVSARGLPQVKTFEKQDPFVRRTFFFFPFFLDPISNFLKHFVFYDRSRLKFKDKIHKSPRHLPSTKHMLPRGTPIFHSQ